jgi:hypothetical protein
MLLAAVAACAVARADHFDVYLLAGQSNAGGHGYVSREYAWFSPQGDDGLAELGKSGWLAAQPDTLFCHWRGGTPTAARPVLWEARSDGWIPLRAGYSLFGYNAAAPSQLGAETVNHPFGAEVTFAERIRAGRPGRKVAIIKYTQGGSGLGTAAAPGAWDPASGRTYQIASLANAGHCYRGLLDLVRDSLAELQRQGHAVELRGMVWHQGENDSGLGTAVYKERLLGFIAAIREDLGKPELPFVIGELIHSQSGYAAVRAAQRQAAAGTPRAAFVSAVGLTGDSTAIHFDTTGQLELGRRYAEAMLQLEWMIGRMRAFNGNFEGLIGEVVVLNHPADERLEIETLWAQPGGARQLAWRSRPGLEYALEWSADLERWDLFRIVPAGSGALTQAAFPDPGTEPRLFLRIR